MPMINSTSESAAEIAGPVLFYDGECGLCSRSVDFVLRRDQKARFQFAPLQGETAAKFLSADEIQSLSSVILRTVDGQLHRRSSAVVAVFRELGGWWNVPSWILRIIPRPIRDLGYAMVARFRYQIFGRARCRIPTPEERSRFLS